MAWFVTCRQIMKLLEVVIENNLEMDQGTVIEGENPKSSYLDAVIMPKLGNDLADRSYNGIQIRIYKGDNKYSIKDVDLLRKSDMNAPIGTDEGWTLVFVISNKQFPENVINNAKKYSIILLHISEIKDIVNYIN